MKTTDETNYEIHKMWATRVTGIVLALAGLYGLSENIMYSGWLIFIAFLVLI